MAGDPYSHVFPGQRLEISAASWNAAMDAAKRVNTALPGIGRAGTTNAREPDVILIRNDSGNDVPRYGVLGIEGVVFDHDDSADEYLSPRVLFRGDYPMLGDHELKTAITLEQIPNGAIGRAVMSGWVQVQIAVNAEADTHARILEGYLDRLESAAGGGFPIIYKESGTGLKWGVVNMSQTTFAYLGRAITEITAADWDSVPPTLGSGTVRVSNLDRGNIPDLICPGEGEQISETWYNMAPQAVNQYAGLVAIDWQGIKLIIVETCELIETTGCDS